MLAEFPGGYKAVLPHLKPGNAIVRFKFVKPGETHGMAFDGLIHVNGALGADPETLAGGGVTFRNCR